MDFVKAIMTSKEHTARETVGEVYCFKKSRIAEKYELLKLM